MGFGGTGDRPLGFAAVKYRLLAVLLLCGSLIGCKSSGQIAGLIAGGATGGATGNPAIGFAVGVAVDAGTTWAVRYYGRERQGAEQDAIAEIAGELPVGTQADWRINHTIPIGDEHGRLEVTREIDTKLAPCKEIAFSVAGGDEKKPQQSWFITSVCRSDQTWKWAAAEPAVPRWGYLQ
jgi:hypothetical protein